MEIKGKIIVVSPRRDGTSQRTGNTYAMQEFVIESPAFEDKTRKMAFKVFGEDRLSNMHLAVGDEGTLSFDIDAREYNGRWYNDITAWRFARTSDAAPTKGKEQPEDDIPF